MFIPFTRALDNLLPISVPWVCTSGLCHCSLKADSHVACRAHAVPLPCRVAKGLERVFPI